MIDENNRDQREERGECRDERREQREERQEQRSIISSRESDELRFKREHDFENLAQIPQIALSLKNVENILTTCNLPKVKTDVEWLKGFFWLLASAVITEFCALIALVLFKMRG